MHDIPVRGHEKPSGFVQIPYRYRLSCPAFKILEVHVACGVCSLGSQTPFSTLKELNAAECEGLARETSGVCSY